MPIIDLYEHGERRKEVAHFATLASLAAVDGEINPKEKAILDKFAFRLHISEEEYAEILKKENKYPIETPHSAEKRLKRLFDFFKIIFSDHEIDEAELKMVKRYALGLGFPSDKAESIIQKSIKIFSGNIPFEDYQYLVEKK
ncbi:MULTISPECIES: TerB family tellurite resistance protein [Flavobacteriaceae]|uniref:TerB family tellurite resistance protein n=1 Tax=Flavobacteriaceae TaxID=49546 RepID=UPI0010AED536|nr:MULTISPECIES: TerB family tellurite resistance protein [Flavobacteriaceae]NJB36426.1 TerB family tellurite resistance protein [Croceivirga sp. JEA036]TKD66477.1 TerB family tellurite resistance protein [Flavobacterium sp. ASW18X]